MHPITFIVCMLVLIVLGLSAWGLINERRSLGIVIANVIVMIGACGGGLHAVGEGPSTVWAIIYTAIFILGSISLARQVIKKKPMKKMAGNQI